MTLRVGIIGTGVMGADHARLLSGAVSGARVAAVSDVDSARARAVAAAIGPARVHPDALALVEDDGVDAVVIASSDQTHEQYVLACVAAGKPVLCEKPLAPTVDGCQRILDAETGSGTRLITVGFMRRYDPGYAEMKRALDDGELGAPLLLHCVHRNPGAPADLPSRAVLTNSAVHELDVSRWLLGEEIVEVTAHTPRSSADAGGTADPQFLVLRSASGVVIGVEVFVNARYGYEVRCELVGERGTAMLDTPPAVQWRRDGAAARMLPHDWRPRFAEAYRRELQDWIDTVGGEAARSGGSRDDGSRDGGSPDGSALADGVARGASAWDGFAATFVAQACVRAFESGVPQRVDLPPRPKLYL